MLVSDFNYALPEELIAQEPLPERDSSRLLHVFRSNSEGELEGSGHLTSGSQNRQFRDFPSLLRPDDLLVFNNTRVIPARLYGTREHRDSDAAHGGRIEVLLTKQVSFAPNEWECLVRPGKKVKVGERLFFTASGCETSEDEALQASLTAEVVSHGGSGERRIRFDPVPDFMGVLEQLGHVPLPPYMHRRDLPDDKERYQTVYARERGSVAAPTAGLHFTPFVLADLRDRGIEMAEITLHVGLGTFSPVREAKVEEHRIHRESFEISPETAAKINRAMAEKRRVVAVGTTTVRTLESSARNAPDGFVRADRGDADIFIYPPYDFKVVGAVLTNFHLPKSTLLMLTCAFGGIKAVLSAYKHAVEEKYRFYSYGDCMFIE